MEGFAAIRMDKPNCLHNHLGESHMMLSARSQTQGHTGIPGTGHTKLCDHVLLLGGDVRLILRRNETREMRQGILVLLPSLWLLKLCASLTLVKININF